MSEQPQSPLDRPNGLSQIAANRFDAIESEALARGYKPERVTPVLA